MARRRGTETLGDMARSLGLVLVLVALIGGFAILSSPREPTVRDVDVAPVLTSARQSAPFEVLAPAGLPAGWTTSQVSFDGGGDVATLRLNYVTDAGGYVGLVQTNDGDVADVVAAEVPDATADGQSVVVGQTWPRWRETGGDAPDRALVRDVGDSVVVLFGSAGYSELDEVAARLR
jgi:hypothetical protein